MPTIKELGIKYRKELQKCLSEEKALEIAEKINNLTVNGKIISNEVKNKILSYIEESPEDPKTGLRMITDSDNTAFLKLVAVIKNQIKGVK